MSSTLTVDGTTIAWAIAGLSLALSAVLAVAAVNRHRLYRSAQDAVRSLRELHENISEGVFRSTLDGRMISANPALVRLNGFASEEEMLREVNDIGGRWYVEPGRRDAIHKMLVEHGQVCGIVSEVHRYKSRERIWIEEGLRLVRDPRSGQPRYYEGTVREVTETIRRLQLQERFAKIASVTAGCLYQLRRRPDGTSCMPYASEGLLRIFGVDPADVADDVSILHETIHPEDRRKLLASFHASPDLRPRQLEYRVRTRDGVEKWVAGHSAPEREPDGTVLWHGYVEDVTERKAAEERIFHLAYRDPLTGLPNRTSLIERLHEALARSARRGTSGALLFVDLDQFKVLNDTKGHHAGDALLVEVARRLESVVGHRGMIARHGGDEFVILLTDARATKDAVARDVATIANGVIAGLAKPFAIDDIVFRTTASIGVSFFDPTVSDAGEHLKRADLAMYEAKARGRGLIAYFAPEMQAMLDERTVLTGKLHDALDNGGLALVCQPQVDSDGNPVGVELLMRWDEGPHGAVPPLELVSLAERAGLSALLDAYVLRRACALLERWAHDPAMRHLSVAANVSARRLHKDFVRDLADMIGAARIDPSRLTLELTEHVMLDSSDLVVEIMHALKDLGVAIALDDFGTGYSSLTSLKRLPIDILKIDLSFVRNIDVDSSDRVIVRTIINVARSLGLVAIAEGVETEIQVLLLKQFGCRLFQGYLFGRPMTVDALENWIESRQAGVNPERKQA